MEYIFLSYETGKKQGNKKRVVLMQGEEVPVLVHYPKVWEHPSGAPGTLRRRTHPSRNLPYNKIWAAKLLARYFCVNGEHHKSRNITSLQRGGSLIHLLSCC
jgi:hypothetical protein